MSGIQFQGIPNTVVRVLCLYLWRQAARHLSSLGLLAAPAAAAFSLPFSCSHVSGALYVQHPRHRPSITQFSNSQALKSYAGTVTVAAKVYAVAQQQLSGSSARIGTYSETSDDKGGAQHSWLRQPGEMTPGSAVRTVGALGATLAPRTLHRGTEATHDGNRCGHAAHARC
ncbi:hypothetical protein LSCM1_04105 [Leishmania martiniquensis]|uniref:Uncharacterized protein n=1 Tax=Leishmania martiniquensis TaxID=1580590 RepID=A0A836GZ00_9TRYP|nr:hypothetical protein LSCM1_04105 [Leishmania martiniquensis]